MRNRVLFVFALMLAAPVANQAPAAPAEPGAWRPLVTSTGAIPVKIVRSPGAGRHASVVILYGKGGYLAHQAAYDRYANVLAARGMDAYIVEYYDKGDEAARNSSDVNLSHRTFFRRFSSWSTAVKAAVQTIRSSDLSNGNVALLGFSQGAMLAIASGANTPSVKAIVSFYGGLPGPRTQSPPIERLPPILILQGEADHQASVADAEAIASKAKSIKAETELHLYPGAGHGFDFDPSDKAGIAATQTAIAFLAAHVSVTLRRGA
jgi:dienelactone hydrolase